MQFHYDEDFVEAAVFRRANGRRPDIPVAQIRRFHRERERCYSVGDPDARNAAFFKVHLEWFREWDLEKSLAAILNEFPQIPTRLQAMVFRTSAGRKDDGAELYVQESGGRTGIVAMKPESFSDPECLGGFLRHEFMHLNDMLEPAFGYAPEVTGAPAGLNNETLLCERYRLLWDITIDGRLTGKNRATIATRQQRRNEFDRAFSFWPEEKREETFGSLWSDPYPTHAALMRRAVDPRDLKGAGKPLPGAPCPLCGFPTFHWGDIEASSPHVRQRVEAEFAAWQPAAGICGRCLEMYTVADMAPALPGGC